MKVRLTASCNNEIQIDIRDFITDLLNEVKISSTEKNQIILAVDEAIANVINHAYKKDKSQVFDLNIEITKSKFKADLGDVRLYNPTQSGEEIRNIDIDKIIKERKKGGLGLKLIYSIMDMVVFYTKGEKSFISMVKIFQTSEE